MRACGGRAHAKTCVPFHETVRSLAVSGPRAEYCKRSGGARKHMEDSKTSGNNSCGSVDQKDGVSTSCDRSDQSKKSKQDDPEQGKQKDTKREQDSEQKDFYPFSM